MFKLLKLDDKDVLNNSNFAKNAVFFKDMLCFCNAYDQITNSGEKLPNFCYLHNGELCLEGICLLMKMYSTEFKFETLKLTLDYLKILYFAVASYADGDSVDIEKIISDFDRFRELSFEYCDKNKDEIENRQQQYKLATKKADAILETSKNVKTFSNIISILSVIVLAFSIVGLSFPLLIVSYCKGNKLLLISILVPIVGFIITILLKMLSKNLIEKSNELVLKSQVERKTKDKEFEDLKLLQDKYNKIICEKYEYKMCLSEMISNYTNVLSISEILKKAREYKLLSYNIVYDINRLFISQQNEINEIILDIENIVVSEHMQKDFENIYKTIVSQDWLYYNNEIRLHFLKKFGDMCEREHYWKLNFEGSKINPFDIRVRDLSRENTAYLSSKNKKFISAKLNDILHSKLIKNDEGYNFNGNYSVETLKSVKANYLKHFYNYRIFEGNDFMFFSNKKETNQTKINVGENELIPTFVNLKLKLIEDSVGLGNSDAKIIKSMASSLFVNNQDQNSEEVIFSEIDIEYPKFNSQNIEEFDDHIVYEVDSKKIVGYKVD